MENLFSILEKFTDIKDTQVDRIKRSAATGLPVLNEKLTQLQQLCVNSDKEYLEFRKVMFRKLGYWIHKPIATHQRIWP